MTALRLAEELEVSVRTVCRDAVALGSAGIPLFGDAGHAGGYQLVDGYRRSDSQAAFLLHSPAPLPSSASARCSPPPSYCGHPPYGFVTAGSQPVADCAVRWVASWVAAQVARRRSPSSEGEPGSAV
ncbi:HTH domain-containing protein [Streptomyces sp. NPDC102473]|uniref:HTH domain-containing protein n=1 Tax=unclassified Streptomyces TaxID=2593676 RepID=UPI0038088DE2